VNNSKTEMNFTPRRSLPKTSQLHANKNIVSPLTTSK